MIINEIFSAAILLIWVIFVATILTKNLYFWMKKRKIEHSVAVYYNRKVIHILAGGLCAVIIPFVFSSPLFPSIIALFLAIFTYIPHKIGKLLYWFQTEDNLYEVSFSIMWGMIIMLGYIMSEGDFWIGILPVLFMSVGDAITGIIRNYLYKKRTKSWWGNLVMALFTVTIGMTLGKAGIIAGIVASIIEHFEFYPIDDNITVPSVSFLILILARHFAPFLLKL